MNDNKLIRICWNIVELSKEIELKNEFLPNPDLYLFENLTDQLEDELIKLWNMENEE